MPYKSKLDALASRLHGELRDHLPPGEEPTQVIAIDGGVHNPISWSILPLNCQRKDVTEGYAYRATELKRNTGETARQRGQQQALIHLKREEGGDRNLTDFGRHIDSVAQHSLKCGADLVAMARALCVRRLAFPSHYAFYGHPVNARHRLANRIFGRAEIARVARMVLGTADPKRCLVVVGDGFSKRSNSPISGESNSRCALLLREIERRVGAENYLLVDEYRSTCLDSVHLHRMFPIVGFRRQHQQQRQRNPHLATAQQRVSQRVSGMWGGVMWGAFGLTAFTSLFTR
jgi:hypothetical protein